MPSRARAMRLPCQAVALHCPGGETPECERGWPGAVTLFVAVDFLAVEPRHDAALAAGHAMSMYCCRGGRVQTSSVMADLAGRAMAHKMRHGRWWRRRCRCRRRAAAARSSGTLCGSACRRTRCAGPLLRACSATPLSSRRAAPPALLITVRKARQKVFPPGEYAENAPCAAKVSACVAAKPWQSGCLRSMLCRPSHPA